MSSKPESESGNGLTRMNLPTILRIMMVADISIYFLIDIGVGVIMICMAVPLAMGRVKPNRWYGFRTPKTMENEDIWYRANRYAGRAMILSAVAMILLASFIILLYQTTSLLSALPPLAVLALWNAIMLFPILGMIAASFHYHAKL